jgi:hypothetical protein
MVVPFGTATCNKAQATSRTVPQQQQDTPARTSALYITREVLPARTGGKVRIRDGNGELPRRRRSRAERETPRESTRDLVGRTRRGEKGKTTPVRLPHTRRKRGARRIRRGDIKPPPTRARPRREPHRAANGGGIPRTTNAPVHCETSRSRDASTGRARRWCKHVGTRAG